MDCLTIAGAFGSIFGSIGTIIAIVVAICIYNKSAATATKSEEKTIYRERTRATLEAFATLRRNNQELLLKTMSLENDILEIKDYMAQMEHFAVGVNENAYDIEIVNRMSGGMLVTQYEKYIQDFITQRRKKAQVNIDRNKLYCEYETMMQALFKLRSKPWVD